MGEGVEEYGHVKGDPENIVVKVDPRYFRPTEVELLLVRKDEVRVSRANPSTRGLEAGRDLQRFSSPVAATRIADVECNV